MNNKDLMVLLHTFYETFDSNNIDDCHKLLYIIYNSLFLDEEITQPIKYKIFSLIDKAISGYDGEVSSTNNNITTKEASNKKDKRQYTEADFLELSRKEGRRIRNEDDINIRETLHYNEYPSISDEQLYDAFVSYRLRQNKIFRKAH